MHTDREIKAVFGPKREGANERTNEWVTPNEQSRLGDTKKEKKHEKNNRSEWTKPRM